jgi:GYF domain 2
MTSAPVAHGYKDLGEVAMSRWYVSDGERIGPVHKDELSRLLSNSVLTANSLLWKSGMKDWEPAANIVDLKSLLGSLPPDLPRDQIIARLAAWYSLVVSSPLAGTEISQ